MSEILELRSFLGDGELVSGPDLYPLPDETISSAEILEIQGFLGG